MHEKGVVALEDRCPIGYWGVQDAASALTQRQSPIPTPDTAPAVSQPHITPAKPPQTNAESLIDAIPTQHMAEASNGLISRAAVKGRAIANLLICQACPSSNFVRDLGNHKTLCKIGHGCCGGHRDEGIVSRQYMTCPNAHWHTTPSDRPLIHYFDRVVFINLRRRADRLEKFKKELANANWPFQEPERFDAIDGRKVPNPVEWRAGDGTYGCMQSHRHILERAIMDDVRALMVLEDDWYTLPGFLSGVSQFLLDVPDDWDQLMFGGQHIGPKIAVSNGVVRCTNTQRTHMYAIRGKMMRDVYQAWVSGSGHCDHIMGPMQAKYNVYAPDPFLSGQEEDTSDISGSFNPRKLWKEPPKESPFILMRCSREIFETMRQHFHSGRMRHENGVDKGLDFLTSADVDRPSKIAKIREWATMIQWEAVSMSLDTHATIWCPGADVEIIKEAITNLKIIDAASLEDALAKVKK